MADIKHARLVCAVFIVLTLAAGYTRIRYGWDWDQSYMILMAERIAHGKVLFRDLWDLHQTGAVLDAPMYAVYSRMTGSTEGIAVFLRICSLVVQYICAAAVYFILKRHYPSLHAFLIAILTANFLPRAVQHLEYSTMAVWGGLLCSLILLNIWKRKDHPHPFIASGAAGLFYSLSVFAYPTMILSIPYMAFLLGVVMPAEGRKRGRHIVTFFGTCLFCVCLLILYLSCYMPLNEIPGCIEAMLESGDHPGIFLFLTRPQAIIKSAVRILGLFAGSVMISALLRKLCPLRNSVFYVYAILITVLILGLNLTGIRPSGPFGLLERYLGLVVLNSLLGMHKTDRGLFYTVFIPGILIFIGSLAGSNLGMNENAMYLESSIFAVILHALNRSYVAHSEQRRFSFEAILFLCFGMIFSSAYFVRIDSTRPANITDCTAEMMNGPLKGIWMLPEKEADVRKKGIAIETAADENSCFLLITQDPIPYLYAKGSYDAPSYAATAQYDKQWVNYYFGFERPLPDQIFIDYDLFETPEAFRETPFGKAVLPYYSLQDTEKNSPFYELAKKA